MGTERWKILDGFEDYAVSTHGRIKSYKYGRKAGKVLKPSLCNGRSGQYAHVSLHKEGKCYGKLVHRLVAEVFIPNPLNKPEVNHIDGNKLNNSVENLEWVTAKENQQHSLETGLRKRSQLHGGSSVNITKFVNDKIDEIVEETGKEKWAVVNDLLLKALGQSAAE